MGKANGFSILLLRAKPLSTWWVGLRIPAVVDLQAGRCIYRFRWTTIHVRDFLDKRFHMILSATEDRPSLLKCSFKKCSKISNLRKSVWRSHWKNWHAEFTQPRQIRPSAARSAPALKPKWAAAESTQTQWCNRPWWKCLEMFTAVQPFKVASGKLQQQRWFFLNSLMVVQVVATHDT